MSNYTKGVGCSSLLDTSVSYTFDVFLSYRRIKRWPQFVEKLFLPMLDHWLCAELGEAPRIYFDVDDIEDGNGMATEACRRNSLI
jgi:hypothetical protein